MEKDKSGNSLYLTEYTLPKYLPLIFPETNDWLHNKNFPEHKFRPDYRSDSLKLTIEFDGPQHYTNSKRIIEDYRKDQIVQSYGYKTIRFPMFIQMSSDIVKRLFDKDVKIEQIYPHGFIADEKTLILPADFCELGIARFKKDLEFYGCKKDILESLKIKVEKLGDINLVLPPSLQYLISE